MRGLLRTGLATAIILLTLTTPAVGLGQQPAAAKNDRTREFPAQKCRYKLPGPDWSWVDQPEPNSLLSARDRRGFVVTLSVVSLPPNVVPNQSFADSFEKGFYRSGEAKKRGGRFVTFHGVPSYETHGVMPDGRTIVGRAILANGLGYNLGILGGREPVDVDPGFEEIMNGFAFTEPPTLPAADGEATVGRWSERMGMVAGFCLFVAVIVGLVVWGRRGKRAAGRTFESEPGPMSARQGERAPAASLLAPALNSPRDIAFAKYRKGMKNLGRSLVALAILQFLAGMLGLAATREPFVFVILGGLGALHLTLGLFALRLHPWVNYAVAIWSTILVVLNCLASSVPRKEAGSPTIGVGIGFLIAGALLYYSIKNNGLLEKAKKARHAPSPELDDEVLAVLPVAAPVFAGHTGVRSGRPLVAPRPAEPVRSTGVEEPIEGTGKCRHCGYQPLAFGVDDCPRCAGTNPNPSVVSRYAGRGAWVGALLGLTIGASWGYLALAGGGPAGGLGGLLVGTLAGIVVGLPAGLLAGGVARMAGLR